LRLSVLQYPQDNNNHLEGGSRNPAQGGSRLNFRRNRLEDAGHEKDDNRRYNQGGGYHSD